MKTVRQTSAALVLLVAAVSPFAPLAASPTPAPYKIDESAPTAKPTYYTQRIWKHLSVLERLDLGIGSDAAKSAPEELIAIRTRGQPDLIGVAKGYRVHAPLQQVVDVTEDYASYSRIWDDVIRVRVLSRDRNRVVTDWLRKAPAFFLPKVHYRMVTTRDDSTPGRVIYHHQLIEGNLVSTTDAVVIYQAAGRNETRVSVLDFFTPDVGLLRAIAGGKIWQGGLENSFKDDVAFRNRLEHPDWDAKRLAQEADRELDHHPVSHAPITTFSQ